MHIPDNYLSPQTCAVFGAAMVPLWAVALRKSGQSLNHDQVPLLGIGAAFCFLIMLFNIPLPGGTTGHAVGGTLVAILLGPWQAVIAISVALLVQALLFGDGGILSLAANCFNMAVVLPFVAYQMYSFLSTRLRSNRARSLALALSAWSAMSVSALAAALEFGAQPLLFHDAAGLPLYCPYPWSIAIPAMVLPHLAVAGVVEAIFTLAVFRFLNRVAPEQLTGNLTAADEPGPKGKIKTLGRNFLGVLAILIAISPLGILASGTAWGEWAPDAIAKTISNGQALGFTPAGMVNGIQVPTLAPDYSLAGIPEPLGYALSAAGGAAVLVILFKLTGLWLSRKSRKAKP